MGLRDALNSAPPTDPFAAFLFTNMDDASDPNYYGYCALSGAWLIKRFATGTGVMTVAAGAGSYAAAWAGRAGLTYMPPDQIL